MKKILGIFLVALVGGVAAIAGYNTFFKAETTPIIQKVVETQKMPFYQPKETKYVGPTGPKEGFVEAAEATVNAVVHVKTEQEISQEYNPWSDFFGSEQDPYVQRGSGSGVIISGDGYIVTNHHVIEDADKITVSLNNNRTYEATLIGDDPSTDLALLKIEELSLPTVSFGNSDDVKVGQWVLAVGNPFDLTSTVTAGIVSAKARNINLLKSDRNKEIFPIESFIQTDAAVNPGNSGGALVNTQGELVGINTAIASRTGSYSGYSFAIPSSIVEKVTKDLKEFGGVQRAFIGVQIKEVTEETAEELGLTDVNGILVSELTANGAALEAGIEQGDVILAISDYPVNNFPELQEQMSRYRPGESVMVKLWRNGTEKMVDVKLRNIEGNTTIVKTETSADIIKKLGAKFASPEQVVLDKLNIEGGAQIAELYTGKIKESGMKRGFIITGIDSKRITSPKDIDKLLTSKSGGVLVEGIYPDGEKAYYGLGL